MSDTRTYIVPDGQENSTNQMLPWMAMMNGGMGAAYLSGQLAKKLFKAQLRNWIR